jgi:hypothetical protein
MGGIKVERLTQQRRRISREMAQNLGLSAEEEVVCFMKSVLDRFQRQATTRFIKLNNLNSKFGFLLDTQTLLMSEDLDFQHVLRQK